MLIYPNHLKGSAKELSCFFNNQLIYKVSLNMLFAINFINDGNGRAVFSNAIAI